MKITRSWQRSLVASVLAVGLCTSCATSDPNKGTPTPVQHDGKERPLMMSAPPKPQKGTPTPIVENNAK